MAYTIQYDSFPVKKRTKHRPIPKAPLVAIIVVLSLLTAQFLWPAEMAQLKQRLFPWTRPEVQEAAAAFISDIRNGDSFEDAATVFCMEILKDAGYAP